MYKLYLAGPDVFRKDAIERGMHLKRLCEQQGAVGLFPMDNEIPENIKGSDNPLAIACHIRYSNIKMIMECDGVVANTSPFRGPGCDAGTAFEIGYALALKKPVFQYTDDPTEYYSRARWQVLSSARLDEAEQEYPEVENFGLCDNLMFGVPPDDIDRSPEKAIESVLRYLNALHATGQYEALKKNKGFFQKILGRS